MILLNGVPIHWRSQLQSSGGRELAVSSAVAEIYALYDTLKESRLYNWRCKELGMTDVMECIHIKVDNKQAKSFAESTCPNSRIRGTVVLK